MELRVFSPPPILKLLGVIDDFISLIWIRKYFEPGSFELSVPMTDKNISLLMPGNIIHKNNGIDAGVIEIVENTENTEMQTAIRAGRFIESYFDRRLIKSTFNYQGLAEMAMHGLVSYVEPLPSVVLGDLQGFNEAITFQATMKNLCTTLTKIAKRSLIGYRLKPDFSKRSLLFETYKGVDRTAAQGVHDRVIFSDNYQNLNNAIYKYNDQLLRTVVIVGGQGDGPNREYVKIGNESGLALRELFVDAKDINPDELTHQQYVEALQQRGYEALSQNIIFTNIETEIVPNVNFIYKKHYDLGDIVTVIKKSWGLCLNQRIIEISEIYQESGLFIVPTLGDPLPEKLNMED